MLFRSQARGAPAASAVAAAPAVVPAANADGTSCSDTYTSGGTITLSANVAALYSAAGTVLGATGDESSAWTGTGKIVMPLAATVSLTAGSVYYVAILYNGAPDAGALAFAGGAGENQSTVGQSGAGLRWSTNGSTNTKLPASFTPSSNATSNAVSIWVALN